TRNPQPATRNPQPTQRMLARHVSIGSRRAAIPLAHLGAALSRRRPCADRQPAVRRRQQPSGDIFST
ncbi:MAG: hypothetical protein J7603_05485, partial [Pseudacidovorax sp.]|nr:hypothetical protein [Pseudacidovorax sp.]